MAPDRPELASGQGDTAGEQHSDRLRVDCRLLPGAENGRDVVTGLTAHPKWLSAKYFYDERGSQLFEQICRLPEYYPTRTEASILQGVAPAIAARVGKAELLELGSGSSTKTRLLLDAFRDALCRYVPVDVSSEMLVRSAQTLLALYPHLHVRALVDDYFEVWERLPATTDRRLAIFLGSTLGNLPPTACDRFLAKLSAAMRTGDYFLLGIDLQKPVDILEAAYNDSQGVTAAFNLNMLSHLNRRFAGNFAGDRFEHHAFYNRDLHQIEMHLVSQARQTVRLDALNLDVDLAAGESILTEISRKFDLDTMQATLAARGWELRDRWTDANQWFGLLLVQKS